MIQQGEPEKRVSEYISVHLTHMDLCICVVSRVLQNEEGSHSLTGPLCTCQQLLIQTSQVECRRTKLPQQGETAPGTSSKG